MFNYRNTLTCHLNLDYLCYDYPSMMDRIDEEILVEVPEEPADYANLYMEYKVLAGRKF
jgi:hypothetical protein